MILSSWVVIDDQGRPCGAAIERSLRELKGYLTETEFVEFLTVNCGFAAIQFREHGIHVRFRPDMLAEKALAELLFRVYDAPWRRALATTFVDGAWRHDILPADRDRVIGRLSEIVMDRQAQSRRAVLRRSRPAQSVPALSPMGRILHEWHARPNAPSRELRSLLVHEIEGRYVWVNAYENGNLIMAEIGRGFPKRVGATLEPGLGYRLQDQPDVVFGRYCAEVYGAAASLGMPMLEDVDAMMRPPDGQLIRRQYSRLILPFQSATASTRLLGVSFEDPGIDLRSRAV